MRDLKKHWFARLGVLTLASATVALHAQSTLQLIQPGNLVYQGAFRLPAGQIGASEFGYGGTALGYNAALNSLFVVGHAQQQLVAEVSIPALQPGNELSSLATATVLQPFADVLRGGASRINPSDPNQKWIGGLLPYLGRLYVSAFSYYDGSNTQTLSHFVTSPSLGIPTGVGGPFQVGTVGAGFISGYFAEVPANLQSLLGGPVVSGNCCLNVVTRSSYGPALFAINPANIGVKNPVPAGPLVYYTSTHFVNDWDVQSTFFNGATHVRGVVIPSGSRSILFFGRQGLGPFCYGQGTFNAGLNGKPVPGEPGVGYCYDPSDSYKGTHSYPYASSIWAYDALDLAAVKSGQKQPWDVRPYATWEINLPFSGRGDGDINGATFDAQTGRIYLTQAFGDDPLPLVHVFTVSHGSAGAASYAPTIVRVVP